MKKIIILFIVTLSLLKGIAQNVGIGTTTPNASAALDVTSTSKGMLIPRMTSSQRNLIPSPAIGLLVYDNTTGSFWFRNGFRWLELVDSSNTIWSKEGSNVYVNNGESVGIGTNTPDVKLHVNNGTNISGGSGGFLQLGSTGLANLAFDNNGIQARNNGVVSGLFIQNNGGDVSIGGGTPMSKLDINGQLTMRGGSPGIDKVLMSDANGTATWRNTTRGTGFFVENLSTQFIPNNTDTRVNFPTVHYDDGGNYNTANDFYDCPTAGFYHFDIDIISRLASGVTNNTAVFGVSLMKNGTVIFYHPPTDFFPNYVNNPIPHAFSVSLNLAAHDHISLQAFQNTGTTQAMNGIFSGYRLY